MRGKSLFMNLSWSSGKPNTKDSSLLDTTRHISIHWWPLALIPITALKRHRGKVFHTKYSVVDVIVRDTSKRNSTLPILIQNIWLNAWCLPSCFKLFQPINLLTFIKPNRFLSTPATTDQSFDQSTPSVVLPLWKLWNMYSSPPGGHAQMTAKMLIQHITEPRINFDLLLKILTVLLFNRDIRKGGLIITSNWSTHPQRTCGCQYLFHRLKEPLDCKHCRGLNNLWPLTTTYESRACHHYGNRFQRRLALYFKPGGQMVLP